MRRLLHTKVMLVGFSCLIVAGCILYWYTRTPRVYGSVFDEVTEPLIAAAKVHFDKDAEQETVTGTDEEFAVRAPLSGEPIHFIDAHGHYVPLGPEFPPKSKMAVKFGFDGMPVDEFIASMNRWGVDVFINELCPSSIWLGGTEDDFGIPKMSELYPQRVFCLYGGEALRLLYRVVEKGHYTAQQEQKFVRLTEAAMHSGKYKGFGEIGLHHMQTVRRSGPIIRADHPWMLKLADIAARYDVPIDIHMEATDDSLPALERLLAHNRNAKIIWAHAGWSELGHGTADVWERLMTRHSNLYGTIKHRTPTRRAPSPMVNVCDSSGRIEADWLRLFERFPDRFMIGSDSGPGLFVKHGNDFRHLQHMQAFLRRLPPHLLGPIARDNAIRVFNLPAGSGLHASPTLPSRFPLN
jgi:hypothetical protein